MLTLYTFRPAFGLYDLSPFVTKVATWLNMAKIEYTAVPGNPRKAPKGKMPYIDHDGKVVADSSFILAYCAKTFGVDLDEGMTPRERATARAVQSMIEEHMYFTTLVLRWQDPRGWAVVRPRIEEIAGGVGVPGFLRGTAASVIRKGPMKNAWGQGMGRHAIEDVETIACGIIDATAELMSDGPYFFGEHPRSLDATVSAFVNSGRTVPLDNRVRARITENAKLVAYCERVEAAYGPKR